MTQTPSDDALLAATIDYLEAQLLPVLEGEHRFKTRLAVNALKALQRSGQGHSGREVSTLDVAAAVAQLDANGQLALKLFKREVALDDPEALGQIEHLLRRSLEINNPKWLNN